MSFSQSIWIPQLGIDVFLKLSFIEENCIVLRYLSKFFFFFQDDAFMILYRHVVFD